MKPTPSFLLFSLTLLFACTNQQKSSTEIVATPEATPAETWEMLFNEDLSNADFTEGVWSIENGELTATEDQAIWSTKQYDNFVLDLEFKNAEGTNSGVIVYCTDKKDWIPNSVEIQIADDYATKWGRVT